MKIKELRKAITEIFVRRGLPTRQRVFNELLNLFTKTMGEVIGYDDQVAESWGMSEGYEKVDKPRARNELRKEMRSNLK